MNATSPKTSSFIQQLTPTNLAQEKAKFFADFSYNPQFIYSHPVLTEKLSKYGLPLPTLSELALEVLHHAYHHRTEAELFALEGRMLSQAEVQQRTLTYLKSNGIMDQYTISWSKNFLVRSSINLKHQILKFRLPVDFREEGFVGMLHHEIGTHALRTYNFQQQSWYSIRSQYKWKPYLPTEEGLAVLHSSLAHSFKLLYISAIRYLAVAVAEQHSFSEVWSQLSPWIDDLERRWMICVRVKRGISDTSQPGSFTKDIVYFSGAIHVWHWMVSHNMDLAGLYLGKIAAEDVPLARSLSPDFQPILPYFYESDVASYSESIQNIGTQNFFDQLPPEAVR